MATVLAAIPSVREYISSPFTPAYRASHISIPLRLTSKITKREYLVSGKPVGEGTIWPHGFNWTALCASEEVVN